MWTWKTDAKSGYTRSDMLDSQCCKAAPVHALTATCLRGHECAWAARRTAGWLPRRLFFCCLTNTVKRIYNDHDGRIRLRPHRLLGPRPVSDWGPFLCHTQSSDGSLAYGSVCRVQRWSRLFHLIGDTANSFHHPPSFQQGLSGNLPPGRAHLFF